EWELASSLRLTGEPMTVHAVGRIAAATESKPIVDWAEGLPVGKELAGEALYRLARDTGLDYGERFRTVTRVALAGADGAVVDLDPSAIDEPLDRYLVPPALLDGAFQGLFGLLADRRREISGTAYLPWRFKRIRLSAPFGRIPRLARLRLGRIGFRSVSAAIPLCYSPGGGV